MPGVHGPQNLGFTPGVRNDAGPERSAVSLGISERHGADGISSRGGDGRDPTVHGADDDVQVEVGETLVDTVDTGRLSNDLDAFRVVFLSELVVERAFEQLLTGVDCVLFISEAFNSGGCLDLRTGWESDICVFPVELDQLRQGAHRCLHVPGEEPIPRRLEVVIWRFGSVVLL